MKRPWYPWYPGDWRRETSVQMCSITTRGVYRELLDCMYFATDQGVLTGSMVDLARLVGCTETEMSNALDELMEFAVCHVIVTRNGKVTVKNRRMVREAKDKEQHRLRQQRYRDRRKSDAEVAAALANKAKKATKASEEKDALRSVLSTPTQVKISEQGIEFVRIILRYKDLWPVKPVEDAIWFDEKILVTDVGKGLDLPSVLEEWADWLDQEHRKMCSHQKHKFPKSGFKQCFRRRCVNKKRFAAEQEGSANGGNGEQKDWDVGEFDD